MMILLFPFLLMILFGLLYYFTGFKKGIADSNGERSFIEKIGVICGIYALPIGIIICSVIVCILFRGNLAVTPYTDGANTHYENAMLGKVIAIAFMIVCLIYFIIKYDKNRRSEIAMLYFMVLSCIFGLIGFVIIDTVTRTDPFFDL